jgi:hypothetical protein
MPMLARRFTIVCLLTALFGSFFAILVAETSRPTRSFAMPCFTCIAHHRS